MVGKKVLYRTGDSRLFYGILLISRQGIAEEETAKSDPIVIID